MMTKYNENYKACVTKKSEFVKTINLLRNVSNNWGSDICLEYKDLKGIFWDPKTEKITDADLGFTDNCKSDSIDDVNLAEIYDARDIINHIIEYTPERRLEAVSSAHNKIFQQIQTSVPSPLVPSSFAYAFGVSFLL